MGIMTYQIKNRQKPTPFAFSNRGDFTLEHPTSISANDILHNPCFSLYCLDPANQQAVFVETPPDVDLAKAPFYFLDQFNDAARAALVPYSIFHQLASAVTLDDRDLVLIHSMGRSGTTLASKAFHTVSDTISYSEPDVFSQFVQMRAFDPTQDAEILPLLRSSILLTCKNPPGEHVQTRWVFKFRSFVAEVAELFHAEFPRAKTLYFYRDGESWIVSMLNAFGYTAEHLSNNAMVAGPWQRLAPFSSAMTKYTSNLAGDPSLAQLTAMFWVSTLECCLHLQARQIPVLPIRYEDILIDPAAVFEAVFAYCGFTEYDSKLLQQVLGEDSQAGTGIGRSDRPRSWDKTDIQDLMVDVRKILAGRPVVNHPDYVLPGTLVVPGAG